MIAGAWFLLVFHVVVIGVIRIYPSQLPRYERQSLRSSRPFRVRVGFLVHLLYLVCMWESSISPSLKCLHARDGPMENARLEAVRWVKHPARNNPTMSVTTATPHRGKLQVVTP